jgi:tetratricopeptide (TPR) repeat protein
MRSTIKILWLLFAVAANSFLIVSVRAMEPDEELLRNPQFLSQHNCLPGYFDVPNLFKAEKWNEAINLVEMLKRDGRTDRYLTEVKAQALVRIGRFDDALIELKNALNQKYLCDFTEPRFPVADDQAAVRNALTWYNIHKIYKLIALNRQSEEAYKKAETLMRKALKYYSGQPDFDLKIERFLNTFSLDLFSRSQGRKAD